MHIPRVSNSSLQYMCKYLHPFPSHLVKHSIFVQYKVLCIQKKTHCLVGWVGFAGALCLFNRRPNELQHAFCGIVLLSSSFTAGLADLWGGEGLLQGQTLNQWLSRTSDPDDSSTLFKSSSTQLWLCKLMQKINQTYPQPHSKFQ